MSWLQDLNWSAPAGVVLKQLAQALPADREWRITLFGSSPLQLGIEPTFVSADVDVFVEDEVSREILEATVERLGLQKEEGNKLYVQVCRPSNFRTHPMWLRRAATIQLGHVSLTIPHPVDILIAKLPRLDDKDLRAFRLVIERLGVPTEEQMRRELQASVDLYRPNFDEEMVGDITNNTALLWQEIWGKSINVRQEIIAPALEARRVGYVQDMPVRDYKAELRRLSED